MVALAFKVLFNWGHRLYSRCTAIPYPGIHISAQAPVVTSGPLVVTTKPLIVTTGSPVVLFGKGNFIPIYPNLLLIPLWIYECWARIRYQRPWKSPSTEFYLNQVKFCILVRHFEFLNDELGFVIKFVGALNLRKNTCFEGISIKNSCTS